MNDARIAYLKKQIAIYTNPPAYVNADWAAKIVRESGSDLAILAPSATPAGLSYCAGYLASNGHKRRNTARTCATSWRQCATMSRT